MDTNGWARRSYVALLRLLFRRREPDELADVSRDGLQLLQDARSSGRVGLLRTWMALVWDALIGALTIDVNQGFRAVIREPRRSLGAAAWLGFGIAVTATLFAFVDAAVLRPLPFEEPRRLVMIWETSDQRDREGPAPGNFLDWTTEGLGFQAIAAWASLRARLSGGDSSFPIDGVQVTNGFFDVFRASPILGRVFNPDEYRGARPRSGAVSVVVIADELWTTLGRDPGIIGQDIDIDGRPLRVVGVMPRGFFTPGTNSSFWVPWDLVSAYEGSRQASGPPRDFRFLRVAARLERADGLEDARRRIEAVAADAARQHPQSNAGWRVRLVSLRDEMQAGNGQVWALSAAILCLLLLVCANFTALTIARAATRAREFAVRTALGASRSQLVRQCISEAALVCVVSASIALLLTSLWLDGAMHLAPRHFPRLQEAALDWRVLAFIAATALGMACVSGVIAGVWSIRREAGTALRENVMRGTAGRFALRRYLVAGELALAFTLLVLAGLFARTFISLRETPLGFDPAGTLVLRVSLDPLRYQSQRTVDYYRRLLTELRALPDARAVAAVTALPLSDVGSDFDRPYWAEGPRPAGAQATEADVRMISPGYFETLRRPLRGRDVDERDTSAGPRVAIVNDTLARQTWRGDPIDRTIMLDYLGGTYPYRVVGVAGDVRHRGGRSAPRPEVFIPHAQNPYLLMNVLVRTGGPAEQSAAAARRAASVVDPSQPLHSVTTMESLVSQSMDNERTTARLFVIFALAAAVVAVCGVYALCRVLVATRHREIAIRMAIGASRIRVAGLLFRESLALAVFGVMAGAACGIAAARLMEGMLFGVSAFDVPTIAGGAAALVVVVMAATAPAVRQATAISTAVVLKDQSF